MRLRYADDANEACQGGEKLTRSEGLAKKEVTHEASEAWR